MRCRQLHTIVTFQTELGTELSCFIQNVVIEINKSAISPKLFQTLVSDLVNFFDKTVYFLHN